VSTPQDIPTFQDDHAGSTQRRAFDWRGWIVVAWVLWFGLLYGQMVVAQRSQRIRELISALSGRVQVSAAPARR
jgi:hypothetical protein